MKKVFSLVLLVAVMMLTVFTSCEKNKNNPNNGNQSGNEDINKTSFDIEVSNILAGNAEIKVIPSDKDVKYYVYAMPKAKYDVESKKKPELGIFAFDKSWYTMVADHSQGDVTWQKLMEKEMNKGDKSFDLYNYEYFPRPNTEYVFYCYGIDFKGNDDDKPITKIFTKTFTTTDTVKSDNKITVVVPTDSIEGGASATITTTNKDTYFVGIGKKTFVNFYKSSKKFNFIDMAYKMVYDIYIENAAYTIEFFSGDRTITPEGRFSCPAGEYYLVYFPFNRKTGIGGKVEAIPFTVKNKK